MLYEVITVNAVTASVINMKRDYSLSWMFLASTILSLIIIIIQIIIAQKNIHKYVLKMNKEIAITEKESLYYFPAPTIIIDENNIIVWNNKLFSERVFSDKDAYGESLTSMVDIDISKLYTKSGAVIKHDNRYYRVITSYSIHYTKLYEDVCYLTAQKNHIFL